MTSQMNVATDNVTSQCFYVFLMCIKGKAVPFSVSHTLCNKLYLGVNRSISTVVILLFNGDRIIVVIVDISRTPNHGSFYK